MNNMMHKFKQHIYDDVGRIYEFDNGSRYYSVTTALGATGDKSFLDAWKKRLGKQRAEAELKYAGDIGTQMHESLEYYLIYKEEPENYPNSVVKNLSKQIIPYLDRNVSDVFATEKVLYSNNLKLAGTADGIVHYRLKSGIFPVILDFKTSKKLKQIKWMHDYFLQLAIYAIMMEELYGQPINSGVLLFAYKQVRNINKEFIVNLTKYKQIAIKRIEMFHKMIDISVK